MSDAAKEVAETRGESYFPIVQKSIAQVVRDQIKQKKQAKRKLDGDKEEKEPDLKDPLWVGQSLDPKWTLRDKEEEGSDEWPVCNRYVVLKFPDPTLPGTYVIHINCRSVDQVFMGWETIRNFPVTLRQVGREAVLSLHRNQGTEEICLTIECPY